MEQEISQDINVLDTLQKNEKKQQLENDLRALKTLVSMTEHNLGKSLQKYNSWKCK